MSITVKCLACAAVIKAPESLLGRTVKCPKCAAPISVGAVTPTSPPVAAVHVPQPVVMAVNVAREEAMSRCPYCGEDIRAIAKKCKHCGEIIDPTLRDQEALKREVEDLRRNPSQPQAPMVFNIAGGSASSSSSSSAAAVVSMRPSSRRSVRSFPHLMHFVLTFFTCGAWLPIWILHYTLHLIASGQNALLVAGVGIPVVVCMIFVGLVLAAAVVGNKPATTASSLPSAKKESAKPPAQDPGENEKKAQAEKEANQKAKEEAKRKADEQKAEERQKAEEEKAEMKAAANLRFAKKLISENQLEKAKERLKEIIREFPNTEAAKESRDILDRLNI
jgi:hypothetical protein